MRMRLPALVLKPFIKLACKLILIIRQKQCIHRMDRHFPPDYYKQSSDPKETFSFIYKINRCYDKVTIKHFIIQRIL